MAFGVGDVFNGAVGAFNSWVAADSNVKVAQANAQGEGYKASYASSNSYIQANVTKQNIVLYSVIGIISFSALMFVFKTQK
jgi:hypothetical protein